jgi:hypothetical protein
VDTARVGQEYNYVIQAIDNEGQPITFSATLIPDWLTFDPALRLLSGTPDYKDGGNNSVSIAVSDGRAVNDHDFIIRVFYPLGLSEVSGLILRVYPNPADEVLHLESAAGTTRIEILDLSGRTLITQKINPGTDKTEISIAELEQGLYMLRVFAPDSFQIEKVIIQ